MKKQLIIFLALGFAMTVAVSCKNEVPTASKIQLSASTLSVSEGLSKTLTAKVEPAGADQNVSWRSLKEDIVTVDEDGVVTGIKGGKAYVVASAGTVQAGCLVRVVARVTGVELDHQEMIVELDGSETLNAQVLPDIADNDTVYWKSTKPEVAVVGEGIVTGLRLGETDIVVITAEGGFTDTCKVTVIRSVGKVVLNQHEGKINIGETLTLNAEIRPETATHKEVTWTSSDDEIATVDTNGVITGVERGFATIYATAHNGIKDSCTVEVYAPVTRVELDKTSLEMYVGDREKVVATVFPTNANNARVKWASSAATKVAVAASGSKTVEQMQTGVLTAKSAGSATVTVTTYENAKTATCVVTVIQGTEPVEGITLDKTYLRLVVGGSYELWPDITPRNAQNKGVTWKSTNTKIATVSSTGLVKAVDCGNCDITATTKDGGKVATCKLTVVGFDTNTQGLDDNTYIWND